MRFLACVLFLAVLAVPAAAQPPWYARGEFNGWTTSNVDGSITDYPMVVDPGDSTHYTSNMSGLFDNAPYNWKIAGGGGDNWATSMPTTDGRVFTDVLGEINFHLWDTTTWSDGWFPNDVRRVGYDDHLQFDWEVVGSFNSWPGAPDPNFALTDMGNGLHRGTFPLDAGIYDFKFRGLTATPWDASVGNNFGKDAGNNTIAVTSNGDLWNFELDLPNGRWRAFTDAAPPGQEGDYNQSGIVDAADYTVWRDNVGSGTPLPNDGGLGTPIGSAHYDTWKAHFGQGATVQWLARSTVLGDQPLVDLGGGQYELNMTGLTAQTDYEFKVVRSDLSASVPGSNMKVRANASGEINLNFYELTSGSWGDGWSPANTHRVGYEDHGEFDWQLTGSFIGWTGNDAFNLTDQSNGLHTGAFSFATGTHQFKIRQYNDWNTSIGDDFGNSANNNSFTVNSTSEIWRFELDLPNGRWRVYLETVGAGAGAVPEPGSLAMALVGLLVGATAVRRRC